MVEAPNFEYKYDFAFRKSFSARLSFAILAIATIVLVTALISYFYVQQEKVKQETAISAKTQLHDAVMKMRLRMADAKLHHDTLSLDAYVRILQKVQPYSHSFTLLLDDEGKLAFVSDPFFNTIPLDERNHIITTMRNGKNGMEEVLKGKGISLLIYEKVTGSDYVAGVVCSRVDILSAYQPLIVWGLVSFFLGLIILFVACAIAIHHMTKPLHQFVESAVHIAEGNLDTPLPEIRSQDELKQLRTSFEYMQSSLKQHIEDLRKTTASQERLQSELEIAHDIQMGMLTTTFPERDDLELFAQMTPAKEVGGDLYDFIIDKDEVYFIIGDVAGKGVPASLYMAVTRTLFRSLAKNYQNAANIVREMNHAIVSSNDSFVFVTAFVGVLDLRTHHLTYCNAAHNAPALMTNEGECGLLEVEANLPLGVDDQYHYEEQQMDFPEGTALLLYTDGLTEAMYISADGSRKLFGEERVLHDMKKNKNASAIEIIDFLKQHVNVFADGTMQGDDLTLLFLRHGTKQKYNLTAPRRIILKNEITEVSRLSGFFHSVCREHDIDEETFKSLNLAIEECVANVINYAYPKGTRGHVEVTARMEADVLSLMVKDHGIPFDPTEHEDIDIDAELNDRPIGGLGIFLVKTIMDTMHYERTADGYNVLTLTKQIEKLST